MIYSATALELVIFSALESVTHLVVAYFVIDRLIKDSFV